MKERNFNPETGPAFADRMTTQRPTKIYFCSVSRAPLKMHGVFILAFPAPAPFKPEGPENFHDLRMHVAACSRKISLRVEIDRDAPTVRG